MTKTYVTHHAKYYLHVYPEFLCKKQFRSKSGVYAIRHATFKKKKKKKKNLVYKLEPTLIVQVVLVIILIKPDLSGSGSM